MKILFSLLAAVVLVTGGGLGGGGLVHAGAIGNPTATVKGKSWGLGAEYDFVQMDLESNFPRFSGDADSARFLIKALYGIRDWLPSPLRYGMRDWLTFSLKFGEADLETKARGFQGEFGFAHGLGLKWTPLTYENLPLAKFKELDVGAGIQYLLFTSTDLLNSLQISWLEYQLFSGVSFEGYDFFTPYGGIYFSQVSGHIGEPRLGREGDFEEDTPFGIFIGADVKPTKQVSFSLEGRLMTETSYTFSFSYHF